MAQVKMVVRELDLGLQDIVFVARTTGGAKLGELHVSRGSLDWWPRGIHTKATTITWKKFATVMEATPSNYRRRALRRGRRPAR
jgi:hypothetical protein